MFINIIVKEGKKRDKMRELNFYEEKE